MLVKKLDTAVSIFIRNRDECCVICGSAENGTNGHLFSRIAFSTRFDTTPNGNCHRQCAGCNLRHEYDPYPYNNWYISNFGKDAWDALHLRFVTPVKIKDFELIEMYENLKGLTDELYPHPQLAENRA